MPATKNVAAVKKKKPRPLLTLHSRRYPSAELKVFRGISYEFCTSGWRERLRRIGRRPQPRQTRFERLTRVGVVFRDERRWARSADLTFCGSGGNGRSSERGKHSPAIQPNWRWQSLREHALTPNLPHKAVHKGYGA